MTRYPLELCLDAKCSVLYAISELRRVEELNYRLDLRIIKDAERGSIEITTGGFASSKAATEKKFYCDKPKLILATECHYNALLKRVTYLPHAQATKVYVPIVQIMGQSILFYSFSIIGKQVYAVPNIMDAEYPGTLDGIRAGSLKNLVKLSNLIYRENPSKRLRTVDPTPPSKKLLNSKHAPAVQISGTTSPVAEVTSTTSSNPVTEKEVCTSDVKSNHNNEQEVLATA